MEIITKKLFINLFTTLFISGATLGFLLATERPFPQTQTEKYILFEYCKPYYDTTKIPKTLDEINNWETFSYKISETITYDEIKALYRTAKRIDKSEKDKKKSKSVIVSLNKPEDLGYAYYKDKKLLAFSTFPSPEFFSYISCRYDKNGKLLELTKSKSLDGYVDYDYKGKTLKNRTYKGWVVYND